MKRLCVSLVLAAMVCSCERKDEKLESTDVIGKWWLTEVLADPGDGSGTFRPVKSNKTLEFYADGTITSNGLICDMSIEANESSSATFSLADSTIAAAKCSDLPMKIRFKVQGTSLIISYPCIEPCLAKYVKK